MANALSNLFSGGYRPVHSPLPPDRFVRSPAGFGFGVPWPWEELPFSELDGVDDEPDLAVAAPRSDGRTALFMVTLRAPWDGLEATDTQAMLEAFASRHRARPRGIRKVTLHGARAQVLEATSAAGMIFALVTSRGPNLVEGLLSIPTPEYLHHFDVMLATWQWLA